MGKKSSKMAPATLATNLKTTVPTGKISRMMIGLFAIFVSVTSLQWMMSLLISALQKKRYDDNPFQHLYDETSDDNNQITPLLANKVMVRTMLRFVMDKGYSTQSASVMDVGCGYGRMVEAWREAGVTNSYGVEWQPESVSTWPVHLQDEYYRLVDLDVILHPNMQASAIKATKFVTSFEVASSMIPDNVARYVQLLTVHTPRHIFFTASTPGTFHGNGPEQHLNQQNFEYWINNFAEHGYHVDWATTAQFKLALMSLGHGDEGIAMAKCWWYAKHMLIFAPDQYSSNSDQLLLGVPKSFSIINPKLLYWLGRGHKVGKLWERDMRDFGRLFQDAINQVHSQYEIMDDF